MSYCSVCGKEAGTDDSFCKYCGAKLRDTVEVRTPDDVVNTVVIQRLDGIKNRNPHTIRSLFDDEYTKFDDWPPFARQDAEAALRNEFNAYHALTNYEYEVRDYRVTVFDDMALATFHLHYTGSMRGKRFAVTSRVTVVLRKEEGVWRVIHEHYSRFPRRRRRLFAVY
jgi:ketosteroid isomerase-like protein